MEKTYSETLKDPRWQKKRLKIFERDNWACRECRCTDDSLQVHHRKYERGAAPWDIADRFLVTLCERCHERATALHREASDMLREMPVNLLFFALDMLKQFSDGRAKQIETVFEYCDVHRQLLTREPYSAEVSRRLEAIDQLSELAWEVLDSSTPRTYGEA